MEVVDQDMETKVVDLVVEEEDVMVTKGGKFCGGNYGGGNYKDVGNYNEQQQIMDP